MHISILFYRNPTLVNAVTFDELDDPMEEDNHFLGDNLQDGSPPEDDLPADDLQDGSPPEDDLPADDLQDGSPPEYDLQADDLQDGNPSPRRQPISNSALTTTIATIKGFASIKSLTPSSPAIKFAEEGRKSRKRKNDQAKDMMFQRRQRRKLAHINYNSPINVEEYQPNPSEATKQWLPELNLSQFTKKF